MISCQVNSGKDIPAFKDSIVIYNIPASSALSQTEKLMYSRACERWYDSTMKTGNFNGGILVAKNGHIIFERYNGTGHIGEKDSITANTPTHIASVSKTFTAMAILKLVQDDSVKLDDEISRYLTSFNYPGVTIRNLLNHRSGLPNYLYFMDELGWDEKVFMKNQDVYDYLVNYKPKLTNITKPDTHFSYCNTNYALLALLIEKVSGISYDQFLKRNFFDPLQMTHSFVLTSTGKNDINPSYDWRGEAYPMNSLDLVYGDKNVYSTTHDLLTWDRALRTGLIFKPYIMEQAYTPYSNEKPGIKNYGLGWRMTVYPDGKKIIFHNGWWHGNNASFIRLIEEDVTIIAIGNRFCRCIYKVKNLVNIFNPDMQPEADEESETIPLK